MLVLTRTTGKKIVVEHGGERLEITVLEYRNGQVKIGLHADRERWKIHRDEVQRRVDEQSS